MSLVCMYTYRLYIYKIVLCSQHSLNVLSPPQNNLTKKALAFYLLGLNFDRTGTVRICKLHLQLQAKCSHFTEY